MQRRTETQKRVDKFSLAVDIVENGFVVHVPDPDRSGIQPNRYVTTDKQGLRAVLEEICADQITEIVNSHPNAPTYPLLREQTAD